MQTLPAFLFAVLVHALTGAYAVLTDIERVSPSSGGWPFWPWW
jgi:hypothetical protein